MFLGTLWSAIQNVKAPFMFDGEHGIALHAMQGNQASSCDNWEFPWFFLSCSGNLGYITALQQGWPFKSRVSSMTLGLMSGCEGHLRILLEAWQEKRGTS